MKVKTPWEIDNELSVYCYVIYFTITLKHHVIGKYLDWRRLTTRLYDVVVTAWLAEKKYMYNNDYFVHIF